MKSNNNKKNLQETEICRNESDSLEGIGEEGGAPAKLCSGYILLLYLVCTIRGCVLLSKQEKGKETQATKPQSSFRASEG